MRSSTRLVVVTHASNVTGAVQPVKEIARVAHRGGAVVLVDAAQSAGHLPIDVNELEIDLLSASGHKGLLGPLGLGILFIRSGVETLLQPIRQGGTGLHSTNDAQPDELPQRYEAGNLNTPALAGLAAATQFLRERSVASIAAHEAGLVDRLCDGLRSIAGVRLFGPSTSAQPRAAVVSFSVEGYDPQDFAAALDSSFDVQCRAGLHCAPRMHAALGSLPSGGLVRLSCGWATTGGDVDRAIEAIATIAAA
jgi:selenocysteine lyase/cysteine desulfurase